MVRLGQLFHIVYGKGLPNSKLTEDGYSVFGANGIIGKYSEYKYESEQLLVSCRGAYSGKPNISPRFCFVTSNSLVLENTWKNLDLKYCYFALSAADKSAIVTGSAQPQVTTTNLEPFVIALPPIEEQRRIALKVDELMALCDQLESKTEASIEAHQTLVKSLLETLTNAKDADELNESWQRISAHFDVLFTTEDSIDQLKQTILQLAVMGKLVKQDPNDEPASKLLERIAAEKEQLIKDKKIKKQKALASISDSEKEFELPKGWAWCRLADAIDVRDGTHDSPKDAIGENTYPLVTSKDFDNGNIDFESARRISEKDHFEINKRSFVEVEDILFSMIGGNIGNQVMVLDPRPFSIKNVALFKYFTKNATNPKYVKIFTANLAHTLQSEASGGAQPFVSLGKLRSLVFALPPVNEQLRIVSKVEQLELLCDSLTSQLRDLNKTCSELSDAICSTKCS